MASLGRGKWGSEIDVAGIGIRDGMVEQQEKSPSCIESGGGIAVVDIHVDHHCSIEGGGMIDSGQSMGVVHGTFHLGTSHIGEDSTLFRPRDSRALGSSRNHPSFQVQVVHYCKEPSRYRIDSGRIQPWPMLQYGLEQERVVDSLH